VGIIARTFPRGFMIAARFAVDPFGFTGYAADSTPSTSQ